MEKLTSKQFYLTLWRWHFYAGVFAIPFVIILSISGAIYLFKPQLEALRDAPYRNLTLTSELASADQQVSAALAAVPKATLSAYELPRAPSDAANILLNSQGKKWRVYVHPQTLEILNITSEDLPLLQIAHDIHGELLLGKVGSVLVELAASWAIVLVLTGVYLWWPRNTTGLGGILYPRLSLKGRLLWKDVHSVLGIWISSLVLFLLISGLPWALVWGSAFKEFRTLTGTAAKTQDWNIAGQHHHHSEDTAQTINPEIKIPLDTIVKNAQQLHFAHPVLVMPPAGKSDKPWMKLSATHWSVKSNAQNRTLRADAEFDAYTGQLVSKSEFSQRHPIDKAVGIGVAAHEGQLFGWLNQLLGLITALGLVTLSIAGFLMWRKRAPTGSLGAPPAVPNAKIGAGFMTIILLAAVLLPVLGLSLIVMAVLEFLLWRRISRARGWLGLS